MFELKKRNMKATFSYLQRPEILLNILLYFGILKYFKYIFKQVCSLTCNLISVSKVRVLKGNLVRMDICYGQQYFVKIEFILSNLKITHDSLFSIKINLKK